VISVWGTLQNEGQVGHVARGRGQGAGGAYGDQQQLQFRWQLMLMSRAPKSTHLSQLQLQLELQMQLQLAAESGSRRRLEPRVQVKWITTARIRCPSELESESWSLRLFDSLTIRLLESPTPTPCPSVHLGCLPAIKYATCKRF